MLTTSLFIVLAINSAQSQINGEFWWLNKKLDNFRKVQPADPVIEVLGEFDNDESAKIVFRDNELFTNKLSKPVNHKSEKQTRYNQTNKQFVWPTNELNENDDKNKQNTKIFKPIDQKNKMDDKFVFNFPKKDKYVVLSSTETVPHVTKKTENDLSVEFLFNDDKVSTDTKDKDAQTICTYISKSECYQGKGVIYYSEWNLKKPSEQEIICCILPIQPVPKNNDHSFIHFPGASNRKPRSKRSEDDKSQNQRKLLLLHKYFQHQKVQIASTPKIVTPAEDDDVDPYWNIKNSKFQTQLNHKIVTPSYNYDSSEYGDYASELPRPGLIGLYSDHAKSPSSWFPSNGFTYGGIPESVPDDYEEDDDDDNIGYSTFSTIDPRGIKKKGKPVKFTTVSDEVTLDAESHTINFQSNPDFQVLQGFKLLNLFRNRSRIRSKNSRKTTTERVDDSKEFLGSGPVESSEIGDEFFEEDQLYGGCGKAVAIRAKDKDKQIGDAGNGSHPWMALVVLTKRRQNVLCYATLIHPRAAVTVADCVQGTSPRDITVIAGAWDLNDRSRLKNRVVDIQIHPRYKAGDDDHNLAVLYWMRPLQLGANIQPACLGEPHVGDECRFFGWGNLGDGIKTRSRWQRASIRLCGSKIKKLTKTGESFCASVSRGSVTSLGGPLICDIDGHNTAVGIVVSTDNGYVLTPIREFSMKSNELLTGD